MNCGERSAAEEAWKSKPLRILLSEAKFAPVGRGCEAEVYSAYIGGRTLKVKVFQRNTEFRRHIIGTFVLGSVIGEMAWSKWVRLPRILAVDAAGRSVLSPFVPRVIPVDGEGAWADRARAVMALVCAAGCVDQLSLRELEEKAKAAQDFGIEISEGFRLSGVDVREDNLIFDGAIWHAVDF